MAEPNNFELTGNFQKLMREYERLSKIVDDNAKRVEASSRSFNLAGLSIDDVQKKIPELTAKITILNAGIKQMGLGIDESARKAVIALKIEEFQLNKNIAAISRAEQARKLAKLGEFAASRDWVEIANRNRRAGLKLIPIPRSGAETLGPAYDAEAAFAAERQRKLNLLGRFAAKGKGVNQYGSPIGPEPAEAKSDKGINLIDSAKYFLTYRAFSEIKDAIDDAAQASLKFAKGITEIQTITQNSTHTFDDFRKEIRAVSDIFGLKIEDVTEATYQAISNQVVKAGDSFQFLSENAEFARATATTLTDAVNLTSSALNSYGKSAVFAREAQGILFKTIELGRVRADEIANSLGSVTVVASKMGVSLQDVGAALATLTVSGVTAANAQTYLRNVLLKLEKPSKEMTAFLADLGYGSGQAAIQALGFAGILDVLNQKIDGSTKEAGKLFTNIRAIQGELGLSTDGALSFANNLEKMKTAAQDFNKAVSLTGAESPVASLERQLNEVRNQFADMGVTALQTFHAITPAGSALVYVIDTLIVALGLFTVAMIRVAATTVTGTAAIGAFGKALNFIKLNPYLIAITLIAEGIAVLNERERAFNLELEKTGVHAIELNVEALNKKYAPALANIDKMFQKLGKQVAEQRILITKELEVATSDVEKYKDAVLHDFEEALSAIKSSISEASAAIKRSEEEQKKSREEGYKLKDQQRRDDFEEEIANLSDIDKAKRLSIQSEIDQNKAKKLAATGDPEKIAESRRLSAQAVKDAQEAKRLNPDKPHANSIDLNKAIRDRERQVRDLERLERNINHLHGADRTKADLDKDTLLQQIAASDSNIARLRGKPLVPGRPDDAETKVIRAKQTQLELEESYRSSVNDIIKLGHEKEEGLKEQLRAQQAIVDAVKDELKAREHASDLEKEDIIKTLIHLGVRKELIESLETELSTKKKQDAADKNSNELSKKKVQADKNIEEQIKISAAKFAADKNAVTLIGSLDTIGTPGSITNQLKEKAKLAVSIQEKIDRRKKSGLNTSDLDSQLTEAYTLTPEQRIQAASAYSKEYNQRNKEIFGGFKSDQKLDILKEVYDGFKQIPEPSKELQKALYDLIDPLRLFRGALTGEKNPGDSKAFGGYSVGGGVHHPGEYVVNRQQTKKFKTLLEMLNGGKSENYLRDSGKPFNIQDVIADASYFASDEINNFSQGYDPNHPPGTLGGNYRSGSINGRELALGQIARIRDAHGVSSFSNLNKDTFTPGFGITGISNQLRLSDSRSNPNSLGGPNSYSFGDINITTNGNISSRDLAEQIRRDVVRQLSTLS